MKKFFTFFVLVMFCVITMNGQTTNSGNTEKTIAQLAAENISYDSVHVILTDATVAYYNDDKSVTRWVVRQDGKAMIVEGKNCTQGFTKGFMVTGNLTLRVNVSDGFVYAYEITDTTDFSKLTKTKTDLRYRNVPAATLSSLDEADNYRGDYFIVNGVKCTRKGDVVTTTFKGNTIELSTRGGNDGGAYSYYKRNYLNSFTDGLEQTYNLTLWYSGIENGNPQFIVTESAANVTPIEITMDEYGYNTLYYGSSAFVMPEGLTATTYTRNDSTLIITPSRVYSANDPIYKVIPENEPVVLKGEPNTTYSLVKSTDDLDYWRDYGDYDWASGKYVGGNSLHGVDRDTQLLNDETASSFYYFFQAKESGIGFYNTNSNGADLTLPAHKVCLTVDVETKNPPMGMTLDGRNIPATSNGIQKVNIEKISNENAPSYNLSGQRIGKNFKGIVIRNGKKYLLK